ncbi:MAG: transporter substrate-binding domain-containing protein [Oscillospiraceae bacterium]|nr:transporter substrate-binding domain-containing protein [Oscillospiraceae bacterium]
MKRILTVFLAAFMLFVFCGCGKDTSLSDVTESKVLLTGTNMNCSPYGYQTESGAYAGFNLDLAQKVATKLGVTLNLSDLESQNAADLLKDGTIDLLAGNQSLGIGEERGMLASDTIFVNKIVIAVRAGAGIGEIAQLSEKNIGVASGSVAEEAFEGNRELKSKANKQEFENVEAALAALNDGSVDAIVADEMFIRHAVKNGSSVLMLEEVLEERPYSLMVRKGDQALKEKIDEILLELEADGTLQDLSIKWFGADVITLKP